jgi:hypothetical protein
MTAEEAWRTRIVLCAIVVRVVSSCVLCVARGGSGCGRLCSGRWNLLLPDTQQVSPVELLLRWLCPPIFGSKAGSRLLRASMVTGRKNCLRTSK